MGNWIYEDKLITTNINEDKKCLKLQKMAKSNKLYKEINFTVFIDDYVNMTYTIKLK